MPPDRQRRIAVIGAGIAGLTCARRLQAAGFEVLVFDKSRGRGGRSSTHRAPGGSSAGEPAFDSGAQYFSARGPRFRELVAEWTAAGAAAPWPAEIVELPAADDPPPALPATAPRLVGLPGMSGLGKALARGLDVTQGFRVHELRRENGRLTLAAEDGSEHSGLHAALFAIPGPQLAPIITPLLPQLATRAARAEYSRCVALLLALPGPLPLRFDGARITTGPLAWIARDSSKPGRPASETWVLHGSPEWSVDNFERPDEELIAELLAAFRTATGIAVPAATYHRLHRWRYAFPLAPEPEPCYLELREGLLIGACGDWCTGPRIENAFDSGSALADRVLAELGE